MSKTGLTITLAYRQQKVALSFIYTKIMSGSVHSCGGNILTLSATVQNNDDRVHGKRWKSLD